MVSYMTWRLVGFEPAAFCRSEVEPDSMQIPTARPVPAAPGPGNENLIARPIPGSDGQPARGDTVWRSALAQ